MNTLLFPVGRGGTIACALTPRTLLLDWSHTEITQTLGCSCHLGLARDSYLGVDQTERTFGYDRNLACPSSVLLSDVEKISISWLPHSTVSKLGIASRRVWKTSPSYASCSVLEPGLQRLTLQGQVGHPGGSQCRCPSGQYEDFLYNSCVFDIMFCKVHVTDTKIR